MLRVTPHAPALGQAARRSSNGRADGGGPERRGPRLERTRCASGPPGGTAQHRPRYRSYHRCRPQPRSSRLRAPRGGMRSRRRRRAPHGGKRSRRPPAGDTRRYTTARRSARLPVSRQSKVQLLETRDARFSVTATRTPTTPREQVSKQGVFPQARLAAGLHLGDFPTRCRKSRSVSPLADRSIASYNRTSNTVPALSHTAHPTSCPHRSLVLLPK